MLFLFLSQFYPKTLHATAVNVPYDARIQEVDFTNTIAKVYDSFQTCVIQIH